MLKGSTPTVWLAVLLVAALGVALGSWLVLGRAPVRAASVASTLERGAAAPVEAGVPLAAPALPGAKPVVPDDAVWMHLADVVPSPERQPAREPARVSARKKRARPGGADIWFKVESSEPRLLTGTIAVVDERGVVHGAESGFLRLNCVSSAGGNSKVPVERGRWQAWVRSNRSFAVDQIVLGGRVTFPVHDTEEPEPIGPREGSVALLARWPAPTSLRVVGADSGRELKNVDVAEYLHSGSSRHHRLHPGPGWRGHVVVRRQSSPVELPALGSRKQNPRKTYFVRSEGYAWRRIEADLSLGQRREVLLERGGGLEIRIDRNGRKLELELELEPAWADGGEPVRWRLNRNRLEVDSLAQGVWSVRLHVGKSKAYPKGVVIERTVQVIADQVARLDYAL